ncbi:hypothetical protein [Paraburkholderia atlantica]|uniref:hypothetical protein n=1 Tax=Paraburkholderia atlantica TaxID=2654982 RepID=UPI00161FAF60|nr:hypothetical protein [Paraburkholderia atlantica]MBB5510412.1 hypothetical protein [Paraburkholderia atlantica]
MLFHASMPAEEPENVARVIAQLWSGFHAPFPSFPDSWMAIAGDTRGSMIEVYPADRVLHPGSDKEPAYQCPAAPATLSAFHLAIATTLTADQVYALGASEGWRAVRCTRGNDFFDVIELWIENHTMIEVLTSEMQQQYLAFASPDNFRAFGDSGGQRV